MTAQTSAPFQSKIFLAHKALLLYIKLCKGGDCSSSMAERKGFIYGLHKGLGEEALPVAV